MPHPELFIAAVFLAAAVTMTGVLLHRRRSKPTEAVTDASLTNEQRLTLLFDNTRDIIFAVDPRGVFTYISPSVRYMGYEDHEVIGRLITDYIHPDDRLLTMEAFKRAVSEGYVRSGDPQKPPPLSFRIRKKDGTAVHFEAINSIVRDKAGAVVHITGVLRDITERVHMQETLSVNEARYRTLIENTHDIIFSYDTKGTVTYASPSIARYGFSDDDVIGRNLLSIVHPDDHTYAIRMFDDAVVEGVDRTVTFRIVLKNGTTRVMEETSRCVRSELGEVSHVIGIMRDVSDRVAMERALKDRTEELEVLNRVIITGSQSSAHDILPRVLDIMLSYLKFPIGACYRNDGAVGTLLCHRGIAAGGVEAVRKLPLSDPEVRSLFTKEPIFENSIDTESTAFGKLFSIASAAVVPVVSSERLIGAIICADRAPHRFTDSEKRILTAVGHEAGAYLAKLMTDEYSRSIEASLSQKTRGIANAQVLQRNLNTKTLPSIPDIDIAASYVPSEELGGDFFDIRKTGARLTVIIADCSGHGIEASMAATLLKAIADRHIAYLAQGEPEAFLTRVNRDTASYFSEQHFPSMFAAAINIGTKEIVYANAGTPLPFIVSQGTVERLAQGKGFLLGYDAHTVYERRSRTLHPGEMIVITSDAFLGIVRDGKIVLDTDGLIPLFARFGRGVKEDINCFLSEIRGISPLPLSDDATVILIEHIPREERHIVLRRLSEITAVSESIGECLVRRGYSKEDINAVRIAFDELCVNAIEHGNESDAKKAVSITAVITCEKIAVTVVDQGNGFDPSSVPDPTSPEVIRAYLETSGDAVSRGRGIWIARRITDSLEYTQNGSCAAFMKKRRPAHADFQYAASAKRTNRRAPDRPPDDGVMQWHSDMTVDDIKGLRSKQLVIDLGDIPMLSSMEISAIIIIHRHCSRKGISLSLVTSNDHLKRTLHDLGLAAGV